MQDVTHLIEFVTRDRTGITTVITAAGVADVQTVIREIEAGHTGWYVAPTPGRRAPVRTLSVLGGAYLFANWDGTRRNNLHDLAHQLPPQPPVEDRQPAIVRAAVTLRAAVGAMLGLGSSATTV